MPNESRSSPLSPTPTRCKTRQNWMQRLASMIFLHMSKGVHVLIKKKYKLELGLQGCNTVLLTWDHRAPSGSRLFYLLYSRLMFFFYDQNQIKLTLTKFLINYIKICFRFLLSKRSFHPFRDMILNIKFLHFLCSEANLTFLKKGVKHSILGLHLSSTKSHCGR